MIEPTRPINIVLDEIRNTELPLRHIALAELTGLNANELIWFTRLWGTINNKRKLEIATRLVELARDNIELNFDEIFKLLLHDGDAALRIQAIEGLWENENSSLAKVFIKLLTNDLDTGVRSTSASALGKFSLLATCNFPKPQYADNVRQALLQAYGDETESVICRRRALESLSPFNLPEVRKAILMAYKSSEPRMKASALYSMGQNCDTEWLPILLLELSNKEPEMRYEAATALGEMENQEAVLPLKQVLVDTDIDVTLAAIRSLGKIGGQEARHCLEQRLENANEVVREAIAHSLEELSANEDMEVF